MRQTSITIKGKIAYKSSYLDDNTPTEEQRVKVIRVYKIKPQHNLTEPGYLYEEKVISI